MTTIGVGHQRLLGIFGVRRDEERMALWISLYFAVTQASHGVGANTADALFFLRFGVEDLPLMILLSGPAVMVALLGHTAGLAWLGARAWLTAVMGLSAIWAGIEWIGVGLDTSAVYPVVWISTQVLIFVTLTAMWNAAGAACSTRQAKRLYPLFATAAVAGGVVGNLAVGPLAVSIGTENLLLVQALLLGVSVLLVRRAAGFFTSAATLRKSMGAELGEALASVRANRLMQLAALAVLLLVALFYLVLFPFSSEVAAAFETEAGVAGYLGVFSSAATLATFLFSLFVTRRVFSRFGLVLSLFVVPLVYLAGFSMWLIAFGLVTGTIFRAVQWVVVNSVQATAYNALFNVLPSNRRAAVVSLMTAVPAQLGTVAAGAILIFAADRLDETGLFVIGVGLAVAACAAVLAMRPAYLAAVLDGVRRGLVGIWELPNPGVVTPVDRDVVRVLEAHLDDPRPRARAVAAAGLAHATQGSARQVSGLLDDEDPAVRAAAFDSICQLEPSIVEPHLGDAIDDEASTVRFLAVRYASANGVALESDRLEALLTDPDARVRAAASWAVGGERGRVVVADMLASGRAPEVTAVLDESRDHDEETIDVDAHRFLVHDDPAVRAAAARAWRPTTGELGVLVQLLEDPSLRVRTAAAESLAGSRDGKQLLLEVLEVGSVSACDAALRALTPYEDPDSRFTAWAAAEAKRAAYLDRNSLLLNGRDQHPAESYLIEVLRHRVDRLVTWVLLAMANPDNEATMTIVSRGIRASDADTQAQAIEALDSLGDREVTRVLLPLLEDIADEEDMARSQEVLEGLVGDFDPWISVLAAKCLEFRRDLEVPATGSGVASLASMSEEHLDVLDDLDRVLMLQRVPMFASLDPEDLVLIARAMSERHFEPDDVIYQEGEAGDELLVIVEGSAIVSRLRDGERQLIHTYSVGDHVGELSLLTGGSRSADIHADGGGLHGLVVTKSELLSILEERPAVAMGMLSTLANRLVEQT